MKPLSQDACPEFPRPCKKQKDWFIFASTKSYSSYASYKDTCDKVAENLQVRKQLGGYDLGQGNKPRFISCIFSVLISNDDVRVSLLFI